MLPHDDLKRGHPRIYVGNVDHGFPSSTTYLRFRSPESAARHFPPPHPTAAITSRINPFLPDATRRLGMMLMTTTALCSTERSSCGCLVRNRREKTAE
ncbi:hypothetical protein CDAR_441261 [Caerostris darwini]|uniref:RRM domain-containing protein n=1 Tax=Caerostris darwini TaxID=1538125 RepID=A0AAV4TTR9_9ARAC|nr:hypothetical protein CDAR_441261 [Caerostris darwini]